MQYWYTLAKIIKMNYHTPQIQWFIKFLKLTVVVAHCQSTLSTEYIKCPIESLQLSL